MTYIQNSAQTSYEVQHLLEWSFFQQSCGLLGTVLYLHDPIPGNLMQTLLHLTPCIQKSVFKLWLLKSKVVSSCLHCLHFDIRLRHEGLRTNCLDGPTLGRNMLWNSSIPFQIHHNLNPSTAMPCLLLAMSF